MEENTTENAETTAIIDKPRDMSSWHLRYAKKIREGESELRVTGSLIGLGVGDAQGCGTVAEFKKHVREQNPELSNAEVKRIVANHYGKEDTVVQQRLMTMAIVEKFMSAGMVPEQASMNAKGTIGNLKFREVEKNTILQQLAEKLEAQLGRDDAVARLEELLGGKIVNA